MEILVASFNRHKIIELKPLFPGHSLLEPSDMGIDEFEIDENGTDYFQNALIKARALRARLRETGSTLAVLADDSGLSVRALGGAPGIRSSRFGAKESGGKLSSAERNNLLLAEMSGIEDRACAFYCCLVFLYGEDRFLSVQETCPGVLARLPRGEAGFGYDPIVFLPELGKTVAELEPEEKAAVSHRGKASLAMRLALDALEPFGLASSR